MKKINAYFTVEAALVFPLVMSALLLTVFLFLFQYDRCLMEQDMGILAVYAGSLGAEDETEMKSLIEYRLSGLYKDKYVAWEMDKLQITLERNEVKIEGRGKLKFPVPEWNFFHKDNVLGAQAVRRVRRSSPADFIRLYRRIRGE